MPSHPFAINFRNNINFCCVCEGEEWKEEKNKREAEEGEKAPITALRECLMIYPMSWQLDFIKLDRHGYTAFLSHIKL